MNINGGKCISEAMKLRGKREVDVARDFGLHRQQINRWKNHPDMRISLAMRLAKYFELHLFDFLKLGEEK